MNKDHFDPLFEEKYRIPAGSPGDDRIYPLYMVFDKLGLDAADIVVKSKTESGIVLKSAMKVILSEKPEITQDDKRIAMMTISRGHKSLLDGSNPVPRKVAKQTASNAYSFMTPSDQERFFEVANKLGLVEELRGIITHKRSTFPAKIKNAFKQWDKDKNNPTTFTDPEILNKQVWFEDLRLYEFERTTRLIGRAFDVSEEEFIRVKPIYDETARRDIGKDFIVKRLEDLDELDASQGFKKMMVFLSLLSLSDYEYNGPTYVDGALQHLRAPDKNKASELAWNWVLKNQNYRERLYQKAADYDQLGPLYLLLTSKITTAPKGSAEVFSHWCQNNGINLRQALVDYELIDIGGPKPEIDVDIIPESQGTSLASQYIDYGISTGSEARNAELDRLSIEGLIAIPREERDRAWFAHCIQKSTGYVFDIRVMNGIRLAYQSDAITTKNHINQCLSRQPERLTLPIPALWMEHEVAESGKMAYLLERLPGNEPGLQGSVFTSDYEEGTVTPDKEHPAISFTIKLSGGNINTTLYKDSVSFRPRNASERGIIKGCRDTIYYMLALNDPSQPLKVTPPTENPTGVAGKSLGFVTLKNGPSIALDILGVPPKPEENTPTLLPPAEPEIAEELDEAEETSDDNDEPEKDHTPKAVALNGMVVQRIFREAGKSHPNNSPELEDDIARMGWLSEKLQTLGSLEHMNAAFEPHRDLADVLFSDDVMRALEFSYLLPDGKKSKKKIPAVSEAVRDNLAQKLQGIFAITCNDTDIQPDDLERNERLKECILAFPGLVIAGLDSEQSLRQARDKYNIPLLRKVASYDRR